MQSFVKHAIHIKFIIGHLMTGIARQPLCLNWVTTHRGLILLHQLSAAQRLINNLLECGLTVKSHVKPLGLGNFIRGFGRAYKGGALYPGGI